mgnify:CR=1 FL=1
MKRFLQALATQRWDDHRYYHQSRINQTLHLVSAISFVVAYGMLFIDPPVAALIGWLVSMTTRQSGHFFFEPRGYDHVNDATDEYKESIKAGYNMRRKGILIGVWVALPALLWFSPSLGGLIAPATDWKGYVHDVGLMWLSLGVVGLVARTVHLFFLRSPQWGLAWAVKILTDPLHNIDMYWRSPFALLRGERLDPMTDDEHRPHAAKA